MRFLLQSKKQTKRL